MKFRVLILLIALFLISELLAFSQTTEVSNAARVITVEDYGVFLNAVQEEEDDAINPNNLYDEIDWRLETGGCSTQILRFGEPGHYYYELAPTIVYMLHWG